MWTKTELPDEYPFYVKTWSLVLPYSPHPERICQWLGIKQVTYYGYIKVEEQWYKSDIPLTIGEIRRTVLPT